jgi:hypothetical protein
MNRLIEKSLSEITRKEWIQYQWNDVTQMGDAERFMLRGFKRTPEEAFEAMNQWDCIEEELADNNEDEKESEGVE